MSTNGAILEVRDLHVEFTTRRGLARVIDGLDITLEPGKTLGIVGESGCGKSMTALAIMRLIPIPPGRIAGGEIRLEGRNLLDLSDRDMRAVRGGEVSMVFQEPMTSLNPVFTVGDQIAEAVRVHTGTDRSKARGRAVEMLQAVGIPNPEARVDEYPHQLSGGMRQRVMIAMALACRPKVLICDEPTTALDVTVQAQVLDLLRDLQRETGTAIILITHDMGVIAEMADRVLVMYAGRKLEEADTQGILTDPRHPYTRGLIACVPHVQETPDRERRPLTEIPGIVPALSDLGQGCPFAPRCELVEARCRETFPTPRLSAPGHAVSCWAASAETAS
jgi:peptide/nickel transport system ATP-binding protein